MRSEVRDVLAAHLPAGWTGWDYPRDLTGITGRTYMIEQQKVEPGATQGLRTVWLQVHAIVPGEDLAKVEDELEAALDELLDALDHVPNEFVDATRGVVNGSSLHAYAVTIKVPARKE